MTEYANCIAPVRALQINLPPHQKEKEWSEVNCDDKDGVNYYSFPSVLVKKLKKKLK